MRILSPDPKEFLVGKNPYYLPVSNEVDIFEAAYRQNVPVLLKGPTGCGKTRFITHMAHRLNRPLITVSCHEDLSASDLIGRYLLQGDETVWSDGPLSAGVRMGAIVYLDEIVEARKDSIVSIHPLTDHRRKLFIDKLSAVLDAPKEFMLVVSYNPGYQSALKEMKPSTRQRFISLSFEHPAPDIEQKIIEMESGVDSNTAEKLAKLAVKIRNLQNRGLEEGVSTRLLVHAGKLIQSNVTAQDACKVAFAQSLSDDPDMESAIRQLCNDYF